MSWKPVDPLICHFLLGSAEGADDSEATVMSPSLAYASLRGGDISVRQKSVGPQCSKSSEPTWRGSPARYANQMVRIPDSPCAERR